MAKVHDQPGHGADAHEAGAHHENGRGHIDKPTYFKVFGALMVLMALTVGAYYLEGMFELPRLLGVTIAMAIAFTKTALIILFFMHIKVAERVTQLYAAAAFVAFAILVIITMGDYFARGWPPQLGPLT
jgi:cytochrome c oxidase subunit 4